MARGATDVSIVFRLLGKDSGFTQMMTKAQLASASTSQKMQYHMAKVGQSMKNVGRTMTYSVTMPIVAGMALAVKAAIDEEKEMALLSKAMRTNAGATQLQVAATERWITKTQNATGVADGELRPALAALLAVTKDTSKAQDLLGVAMDIAAAKGKPLEAVTAAIAKAQLGNVGSLGRLGVATKDAEGNTLSFKEAMKNAIATYGGAAQTAAGTTAGKMAILKAKIADLSETVGTVLIPIVTKIVDFVGKWADKFNALSPSAQRIIVIVAAVAAAIGPLLMVLGNVVTIAPAVGSAFTLMIGPVGLIIVAIAAVVAAFVLLWTKCDWFRSFWIAVWEKVKEVAQAVWPVIQEVGGKIVDALQWAWDKAKAAATWFWGWAGPFIKLAIASWWQNIKTTMHLIRVVFDAVWPVIVTIVRGAISNVKTAIAGVRTVVAVVRAVWDAIKAAAQIVWNAIVGVVRTQIAAIKKAASVISDVKETVLGVFRTIKEKASDIWGDITGVVTRAFDTIKSYANKVIGAINFVVTQLNKLAHTNIGTLPLFGGGGKGSDNGGTAGTRQVGNLGSSAGLKDVPHADGKGAGAGKGGITSAGTDIASWVTDLWNKYGIGSKLPSPIGGLFGNATSAMYNLAKDAILGLLKKFGGGPGQQIIDWAKTQLGKPYLWGATGPDAYDCSGLIYRGYLTAGQSIPRTGMWNAGRRVSASQARPADVGFFYPNNSQGVKYGHVKMYAGNNETIESGSGGVHMSSGILPGASEIRTYLARGGITRGPSIAGELGPEAVIPLTNAKRGAAVMREAGLIPSGGNINVTMNVGRVYATSPSQAQAAGEQMMNGAIMKLAAAKRATNRGTA